MDDPATKEPEAGQRVTIVGPSKYLHNLDTHHIGKEVVVYRTERIKCQNSASGIHIWFVARGNLYVIDREAVRTVEIAAELEAAILALPYAARQRIYNLLYNSGCRINR